ncbi:hypothetical protein CABS03_08126 [Colletotrichum abscissum]|uniref:Uncharacterized protein n=2 Tax=Colletotrichum acutatum species complex TaxID=2707335 RepID=A0A9P9X2W9_9PEZI|nr:hypothetical protein CABS02_13651 [Colletotrichum abscissum]KAK0371952.1 hypothetical protein CLIM01_10689 [Colletotrichum limetticola]
MQVLGSHCSCRIANLEKRNADSYFGLACLRGSPPPPLPENYQYQRGNFITTRRHRLHPYRTSNSPDMWPKTPRADAGSLTPGTSRCSRRLVQWAPHPFSARLTRQRVGSPGRRTLTS